MNIVAIIPARSGSKGLKNKNIYPVLKKPLISWTFKQVNKSKLIKKIFVSTDDLSIKNLSKKHNIEVISRPKKFCQDKSTSESAIAHSIEVIKKNYKLIPDIVVFLQATSPLRKKHDIDNAIKNFINNKLDSLFSATKLNDLCLWQTKNKKWKSINFDFNKRKPRQLMPENYIENGSIYIFKPKILFNENNRLGGKIGVYLMDFWQSWEIDTIEDIDLIEFYMKSKGLIK